MSTGSLNSVADYWVVFQLVCVRKLTLYIVAMVSLLSSIPPPFNISVAVWKHFDPIWSGRHAPTCTAYHLVILCLRGRLKTAFLVILLNGFYMCVFWISLENLHAIFNHRLVSFFILSKCALVQNLATNPQDSGPVLKHYYGTEQNARRTWEAFWERMRRKNAGRGREGASKVQLWTVLKCSSEQLRYLGKCEIAELITERNFWPSAYDYQCMGYQ